MHPSKDDEANLVPSFENSTWLMAYVCPSKGELHTSSILLFSSATLKSLTYLSLKKFHILEEVKAQNFEFFRILTILKVYHEILTQ